MQGEGKKSVSVEGVEERGWSGGEMPFNAVWLTKKWHCVQARTHACGGAPRVAHH